jgi:hypothetical protein
MAQLPEVEAITEIGKAFELSFIYHGSIYFFERKREREGGQRGGGGRRIQSNTVVRL